MKGIIFGNKHSFNDFGLILTDKSIGFPSVKTETVDIIGRDGSLDLTDLMGRVRYGNRPLSFTFKMFGNSSEFLNILSDVTNYLHGQKMKIIDDDDPTHYYFGRCSVNSFKTSKITMTLVIDCDCEPFKLDKSETTTTKTITESGTMNVTNSKMIATPTINVSANMTMTFNNKDYPLVSGDNIIHEVQLQEGSNSMKFTGNGKIIVKFRKGTL